MTNLELKNKILTVKAALTVDERKQIADVLERADVYKWHDLRKYPKDLPEDGERVEIVLLNHTTMRNVFGILDGDVWTVNGFTTSLTVIAWREIEPFEEVTE